MPTALLAGSGEVRVIRRSSLARAVDVPVEAAADDFVFAEPDEPAPEPPDEPPLLTMSTTATTTIATIAASSSAPARRELCADGSERRGGDGAVGGGSVPGAAPASGSRSDADCTPGSPAGD